MSNYRRPQIPGATIFFTVALASRGTDTLTREIETLRQAIRQTRAERPFHINAWVVLPNHMHCVWTLPQGDADFATRMAAIKARFSMTLHRSGFTPTLPSLNPYGAKAGRDRTPTTKRVGVNPDLQKNEASIWQKRYWEHHIRNDVDLRNHIHHCWLNPVKHGLADHPKDWPYSSYHHDNP